MDVLISGASVAGPALAHWLDHLGARTTIVERAPSVRAGGLAVDVRGTALALLRDMGLEEDLRVAATGVEDVEVVDRDGAVVATVPQVVFGGELEVPKQRLTQALVDLTAGRTEYIFDDSIERVEDDGGGVVARLRSGRARRFDLVIGADGLHSGVRSLAFGPEGWFVRPMGLAYVSFGIDHDLGLSAQGRAHLDRGRSVTVTVARGEASGRVLLMFPSTTLPTDRVGLERHVREAFVDVGWEAPRLMACMSRARDLYADLLAQVEVARWSRGRIALVGDAAYCASPMSGRGTSAALVGAYVLAVQLARHEDHADAFAAYQETMRGYVADVQELGRQSRDSLAEEPDQAVLDRIAAAGEGERSIDLLDLPARPALAGDARTEAGRRQRPTR